MPTEEEIRLAEEAKAKELQTTIHSAVATQLKTLRPKLVEELKTGLMEALTPTLADTIKTQFAELQKVNGGGGDGKPPAPPPADPSRPTPEFLALQKRVEDAEARSKNAELRAQQAETQRREEGAFTQLRTILSTRVRPEMVDTLAKVLFHADKRVTIDDKGQPLLKIRRAPMPGMSEQDDELPLEDGVDILLKQKDMAHFLPPPKPAPQVGPGRGGAPPRRAGTETPRAPQQYDQPAKSDAERTRRAMEREAALAEQFPNLNR